MSRKIIIAGSFTAVSLCLLFLFTNLPARAGGVTDLEEGLPTRLEDAYPIGYLGRELQWNLHYDHTHDDMEAFRTNLRLEFGFPRNGQIRVTLPFIFGQIDPKGLGDFRGEFFYNFNQETLWLPAVAVVGGVIAPTGKESRGVDPFGAVIFTKTISGWTNTFQQLHLNLKRRWNDEGYPTERSSENEIVVGYSRLLRSDLLAIVDFSRRWRLEKDMEENLVEMGLRYQLTPLITVSGATGFGIGDESPDVVATAGLQLLF